MAENHHVVVDGSNLATEGRTSPSLEQLDEAVRAYAAENPKAQIVVVVDASFEHRIDPSERSRLQEAELHGEVVSPPAGAIGRGDAFVLRIAQRTGATVLSNDSFQEFHGEHPWLFDKDRLVGGKPVPGVGWIFTPRNPVRGPKSRQATGKAKRNGDAVLAAPAKAAELAKAAKKMAARRALKPDGTPPKIGDVWDGLPAGGPAKGSPGTGRQVAPAKATKATKKAKKAKVAEPVTAAEVAKTAKVAKAAKAAKATKATKAAKSVAEPVKAPGSAKRAKAAAEPARAAKRAKAAEAAEPAKAAKAARAAKKAKAAAEPARAAKKAKAAAEPAKAAKKGKGTKKAARHEEPITAAVLTTARRQGADVRLLEAIHEATAEAMAPPSIETAAGSKADGKRGKAGSKGSKRRRAAPPPAVNEPLTFINFVAAYPLGSEVEGEVASYTSHGAMIEVGLPEGGALHCYVPLTGLGDPPPRKAREVLVRGQRRPFVLVGLDPPRRVAELALPGVVAAQPDRVGA